MPADRAADVTIVRSIQADQGPGYRSTTSDPTAPWKGVKFPTPPHNYGAKAGLDKNGFYLTLHNGHERTHEAHTCSAIPKADLIASNGPDLSHLQAFPGLEIESFPATDLDPDKAPDAPEVLLNKEFGNVAGKLYMYRITWSGTQASISDVQTIALSRTYSTTCVDPSNPRLLWTCQEYANSTVDRQWCTAWVAFQREVNQ
jgi:hypothetical protein